METEGEDPGHVLTSAGLSATAVGVGIYDGLMKL